MPRVKTKSQPADALNHEGNAGTATARPAKRASKQSHQVADGDELHSPNLLTESKSAGLQLLVHRRFKQMQLRFTGKSAVSLGAALERSFWKFRPDEGVYTKQWGVGGEEAATEAAQRLFDELCRRLPGTPAKHKSR